MKDTFGTELKVGDKIVYGTHEKYTLGEILKLKPHKEFNTLDRVEIKVLRHSEGYNNTSDKNPICYAGNMVKLETK